MYPLPDGFAAKLSSSHTVRTQVDVLVNGDVAASLTAENDAGVVSGDVSVDVNATIRRSVSVAITDRTGDIFPVRIGDLLAPPNEVKVWQGIEGFPLVPLGVFGLSEPEVAEDGGAVTCQVKGFDRSRRIQRRKWTSPFTIPSGTPLAAAIQSVLSDRDPTGPALNAAPTGAVTPTVVLGSDNTNDPWADVSELAASAGMTVYYDPDGIPVLRELPDPATDPLAATYAEGDGGLLLGGSRSFTDDPGTNGVIIIGNGTELVAPFRVEVWDTNPASPTYYDPANPDASIWGPVPDIQTTDLIADADTALATATAQLRAKLGTSENVRFTGVPNPGHEAGDVIYVKRSRLALDARYVLDSFSLPLGPGAMTGTCRSRQVM
jgi:hypothetical protein